MNVTPLSSPYNIQTNGREIHSPLPYLIFKTSKQGEGVTIPPSLSSPSPPYPLLSSPSKLTINEMIVQTNTIGYSLHSILLFNLRKSKGMFGHCILFFVLGNCILKLNPKPIFTLFSILFSCLAIVFKAIWIQFFTYN
jgi:hypothetical protein